MSEDIKEQEVEATEAEQTENVAETVVEEKPKKTRSKKAFEANISEEASTSADSGKEREGNGAPERSRRAQRVGVVSSDKMEKTVVVRVDRQIKHPKYRRYVRRTSKFMAHDEFGASVGDKVRIMETRPLSRLKRWRVVEVIQKAAK